MRPPAEPTGPRHLTDADIAAAVHGDAGRGVAGTMPAATRQAHLEACAECRARLNEARRLDSSAAGLLRAIEAAPLPFDANDVIAAARRRTSAPQRRRSSILATALAAVVVLCAAGVVAFAFPTSPLGRWLRQMRESVSGVPRRTAAGMPGPTMGSMDPSASGVAVAPVGGVTVTFRDAIPRTLRIRYCDTSLATLRVLPRVAGTEPTTGALSGRVRFTVSRGRIAVTTADPQTTFELTLPKNTPAAYVTDGAQRILATLPLPPPASTIHGCGQPITVPLTMP